MPKEIRIDNGPEYISHELKKWADNKNITLTYIQPGKPTQKSLIERFNGTCRRDLMNANLFFSVDHARELASEWMHEYNHIRPHSALGDRTPLEFTLWRSSLTNKTIDIAIQRDKLRPCGAWGRILFLG